MATQVLPAHQADGQLFHQPGSQTFSPSTSSLFLAHSSPSVPSSPKSLSPSPITSCEHRESIQHSPPPSSTDSSPRTSTNDLTRTSSYSSTPFTSGISLEDKFGLDNDDDIEFPNYDDHQYYNVDSDYESSRRSGDDVPEISTTTDTTQDDSPLPTPTVSDDTAIKQEPSRHVDYLSHNWREEDIWASWRHIVSQRKVYGQKSRLENASWRTWAKSKYRLDTVSPERLNWMKESDVTWLYGPLKPAESHPITSSDSTTSPSQLSKSASFVNKKPILKKRSVSEAMLQKSISNSSLLKQAAASVQAQQAKPPRRGLNRTNSDFACSSGTSSRPPSREDSDYFSRRSSSATDETPSEGNVKHIRFDEVVEQCVAVECKEPIFDDESDPPNSALSESSSDEGLLMMRRKLRPSGSRGDGPPKVKLSRAGNSASASMIETIPATKLKYRTESPDVTEQQPRQHVFGANSGWGAGQLSREPSQETLRPSRPSRNFLLADDDKDDADEDSTSWSFGASNPRSSLGASAGPSSSDSSPADGSGGIAGMRRTASGMLMPIDEDEDDLVAAGLFGGVSETVNRVKDIGWVLWNSFATGPRQDN
ncbi:protein phosphatase regulator [Vermiconidia calcicola]|uniref:Protein phosphatase regulator n=1 Tax=Vermiconidia calcicola TaxID=1690605 RepID=A0ACC3MR97_9PEZI|nr:protein phosphatase regulator [Vermiconidia calcicola]